jgi:hypothetical protein
MALSLAADIHFYSGSEIHSMALNMFSLDWSVKSYLLIIPPCSDLSHKLLRLQMVYRLHR